ncbi:DUF2357 domain-containing protein, partial [Cronobacter sakazakii]|nr:DUF2357 domain-containing protein [Cronobacter sakazakii]
ILGQHIGSKSAPEPVNESISFVFNLRKGATLKLLYEPKYWMATHPMADLRGLVNSEGWTTYNGMVTHRSSSGRFSNRSPDFVIHISNGNGIDKYLILDAKYTSTDKAFLHYLPELTLKYLHGLHSISDANSSIIGLIILNPDEKLLIRDFHNSSFDIYSDRPAMPFLLCATISPGEEYISNNCFQHSLLKMVTLMEQRVNTEGQGRYLMNVLSA